MSEATFDQGAAILILEVPDLSGWVEHVAGGAEDELDEEAVGPPFLGAPHDAAGLGEAVLGGGEDPVAAAVVAAVAAVFNMPPTARRRAFRLSLRLWTRNPQGFNQSRKLLSEDDRLGSYRGHC